MSTANIEDLKVFSFGSTRNGSTGGYYRFSSIYNPSSSSFYYGGKLSVIYFDGVNYAAPFNTASLNSCSLSYSVNISSSGQYTAFKENMSDYFDNLPESYYDLPFNSFIAFPLNEVNNNGVWEYQVDVRNPVFLNYNQNLCTSLRDDWNLVPVINYTVEIEDSGSGGGISGDINLNSEDIVNAILVIPATLIVISFFLIIYRMFINRRVRG